MMKMAIGLVYSIDREEYEKLIEIAANVDDIQTILKYRSKKS